MSRTIGSSHYVLLGQAYVEKTLEMDGCDREHAIKLKLSTTLLFFIAIPLQLDDQFENREPRQRDVILITWVCGFFS